MSFSIIGTAYAETAQHASSGMPQFETSTFSSQSFWAVVSFAILLFLLTKYVIPAVNNVLDARNNKIRDDIDGAKQLKDDAEKVLADYRHQLSQAAAEAARIQEDAQQDAARRREKEMAELEDKLAKKRASAMEEIEQAKRKAISEVRDVAVELAMLTTEKLIAKSITPEDALAMVDDAIKQLQEQKQLH